MTISSITHNQKGALGTPLRESGQEQNGQECPLSGLTARAQRPILLALAALTLTGCARDYTGGPHDTHVRFDGRFYYPHPWFVDVNNE